MLSPAKPPLRAYAGFRRSRTEPAPHAAAPRPAAQMAMFLADCRPWPRFCPCAGCPTPSESHYVGSRGVQPPGALQCAGAWPVCVTAGSAVPARTRRNQHSGHGSRHGNAAGSALSAFCGPSGRYKDLQSPKRLPPPSTGGEATKAAAGLAAAMRIAVVACLHTCAGVSWLAKLVCRRGRRPVASCRQGVRSAASLASPGPPPVRGRCPPTPPASVAPLDHRAPPPPPPPPPPTGGLSRKLWTDSRVDRFSETAPQPAHKTRNRHP